MTVHKKAIRVNDQYHCAECGKQWDHDDPDPPECKRESQAGRDAIESIRKMFRKDSLHGKQ